MCLSSVYLEAPPHSPVHSTGSRQIYTEFTCAVHMQRDLHKLRFHVDLPSGKKSTWEVGARMLVSSEYVRDREK